MRAACDKNSDTPRDMTTTRVGLTRSLSSVENPEEHENPKKRGKFKVCKKETSLQK